MSESAHKPFKPLWVLFAIIVGVSAVTLIGKFTEGEDRVPWRSDVVAAQEEARRDGKPVFVYFTAAWCGPCQRMKGATWSDAGVDAKLRGAYVPVKIDVDADADTARRFGIEAMPTFVLLDKEGTEVKRASGFMPAGDFLDWIGR